MKTYDEHEHNDDLAVGRILSRREILGLLAGASAGLVLSACGDTPAATTVAGGNVPASNAPTAVAATTGSTTVNCVVKPEMTEGPYFVDEKINRSDIRPNSKTGKLSEGNPLTIALAISSVGTSGCVPLKDAQVDIWHCDAKGIYSDTKDNHWGDTTGQNFLRGYQISDSAGAVKFLTIYPGWYRGRAVHIHFKIRTTGTDGKSYEFTSQFFFDDTLSDQVFTQTIYNKAQRDTLNSNDDIYSEGGNQLTLPTVKSEGSYTANFSIGLDLSNSEVGKSDQVG